MTPELMTDGILTLLLMATILVVWRLEHRLSVVRAGQASMAASAAELMAAASRAEAAIKGLRLTADGCGAELDQKIKRARSIADEIGMLMERGQRSLESSEHGRSRSAEPQSAPVLRALGGAR